MIRVLLVDDHAMIRAGLANLLAAADGFAVVAEAGDGRMAARLWRQHRPDVCLLDLKMPGVDGCDSLRLIRDIDPKARVLILTSSESAADMAKALAAGADGYVTKHGGRDELMSAIRLVHKGGRPVSRQTILGASAVGEDVSLSKREREVLGFLREGLTNLEIADLLGITSHGVKKRVASLLAKLGATDRAQAVARAYDRGLFPRRDDRPASG